MHKRATEPAAQGEVHAFAGYAPKCLSLQAARALKKPTALMTQISSGGSVPSSTHMMCGATDLHITTYCLMCCSSSSTALMSSSCGRIAGLHALMCSQCTNLSFLQPLLAAGGYIYFWFLKSAYGLVSTEALWQVPRCLGIRITMPAASKACTAQPHLQPSCRAEWGHPPILKVGGAGLAACCLSCQQTACNATCKLQRRWVASAF